MISRVEAKQLGQKWYETGIPCKHGHIAPRLVSNATCQACAYQRYGQYAAAKPERFSEYRRKAGKLFLERHPDYLREQYQKHRDRSLAHSAKWAAENRDKCRKSKSEWKRKNPATVRRHAMQRYAAEVNACPSWADHDAIQTIYETAVQKTAETGVLHHVDHIVPLINPMVCGLHVSWNLRVITAAENWSKNNRLMPELVAA